MTYKDFLIKWENAKNPSGIDYFAQNGVSNICSDNVDNLFASTIYNNLGCIIFLEYNNDFLLGGSNEWWEGSFLWSTSNGQPINGICVDNLGFVYCSTGNNNDWNNSAIFKVNILSKEYISVFYNSSGTLVQQQLKYPIGLAYLNNNLYIAINENNFIGILNASTLATESDFIFYDNIPGCHGLSVFNKDNNNYILLVTCPGVNYINNIYGIEFSQLNANEPISYSDVLTITNPDVGKAICNFESGNNFYTNNLTEDKIFEWLVGNQCGGHGLCSPESTYSIDPIKSSSITNTSKYTMYTNKNGISIGLSKLYGLQLVPCFNHDTKILCLNEFGQEQYIPVQDLRKGALVKTYLHGYRKIDLIGKGTFINNKDLWDNCMYKMEKTNENGLLEDLILTGGHSILVNGITLEEKENLKRLGLTDFQQKIDDKDLSLACASPKFKKLENKDTYTFYHFALESEDSDQHFGVWSNGILSESIQKSYFLKHNFTSL